MRHLVLCLLLVSAGAACKKNKSEKVDEGSATTAGSAGSGSAAGSAGSNAAAGSADGSGSAGSGSGSMVANAVPDEDAVARYLKYANGIAPYMMRAGDLAKVPANKDRAKLITALRADPLMKHFVADQQRLLKANGLTTDDIKKLSPLVAESGPLLGTTVKPQDKTAFATKFGDEQATLLQSHAAETKSLRDLMRPSTERKIDCDRQPESCSCQECPVGCNIPGYQDCVWACTGDLAKCVLETAGIGSIICAIPFQLCMDKCNALPCG